jgi:hypothetical protein
VPVDLEICENGHILYCKFYDPWTIDEVIAVFPQARLHRSQMPFKVHMLADLHTTQTSPKSVLRADLASELLYPNTGNLAIWHQSGLLKSLAKIGFQLIRYDKAQFFNTEHEAWSWLRECIAAE